MRGHFIIVIVTILFFSPVLRAEESAGLMRRTVERFSSDWRALERYTDVPGSENSRARLKRFLDEQNKLLDAMDFEALDQPGKIDYILLRHKIRFESSQLDHEKKQLEQIADFVPFAEQIRALEEARRRAGQVDAQQAAKTLTDITAKLAATRWAIEPKVGQPQTRPAGDGWIAATGANFEKVRAYRAVNQIESLRRTLKQWNTFYDAYDPAFTWWMRAPYAKLDKELEEYAAMIRKKIGVAEGESDPVIGWPIGRTALLDALKAEMIPYSPEELIEIANQEFAWCDAEMKKAATDLGVENWHKALDKVCNMHLKPGEQPKLIKELADEATRFVEERSLVTVPPLCKEIWRMEMMSPQRQRVNPYFTGGELISVSFPTDSMSHEDKIMSLRGNNPSFCRATVHHELIPGHHLQGFMAERYNPHRRLFRTAFLVEGWALYWEMLLWDLNFQRTPEDRVGMLFWRSHRCARIIFSLKFHLGEMTAQEAIDFLVTRVGHEKRNATAEVRRSVIGTYPPLYQAAYMLGGLQIRAMRKELVESRKMTDKQFHDAILKENSIPVEMIRAQLTGQKLTRDFKTAWRFRD